MKKRIIGEASIDSRMLYQRLAEMDVGEFISYSDLSAIIGRDVQGEARNCLNTARFICERENDKTFGVVRNEGLKCLSSSEVVLTALSSVEHIRRTSRRQIKRMRCVKDYDGLAPEEKIKFNTYTSILAVMTTMTKGSNIRKIEAKVEETQDQLPYAKALEAFK